MTLTPTLALTPTCPYPPAQIGLYLQLAVLASWGELGLANLPAGIWFFTTAGYLSVLEHDSLERALPFDLWRADDHHMHHAYFKCNYSPYSVVWDKVCRGWGWTNPNPNPKPKPNPNPSPKP